MYLIYTVWYTKNDLYLWEYEIVSLFPTKPVPLCEYLKSFYESTSPIN